MNKLDNRQAKTPHIVVDRSPLTSILIYDVLAYYRFLIYYLLFTLFSKIPLIVLDLTAKRRKALARANYCKRKEWETKEHRDEYNKKRRERYMANVCILIYLRIMYTYIHTYI